MPNGKICYLEIPATDVDRSAAFYTKVFGWQTRVRGDGHTAFDDTTGAVSGSWVLGRKPSRDPGVLAYVMVDDIDVTLKRIVAAGGQIATSRTAIGPSGDAFATFTDPPGNLLGLYQEPRR
jgi:predicted enzyme related to lactoylglutathione lyase